MLDYISLQAREQGQMGMPSSVEFNPAQLQAMTAMVPVMAKSMAPQDPREVEKAWKTMSRDNAKRAPKSFFFDPLSIQYALGYKDRRYGLTYNTLNRVSNQLGVLSAIINTRIAQIAAFSQPYRITKSLGYQVRHKDPERLTTASERRFIKELEAFIADCGQPGVENPYTRVKRPKFENFVKMVVRSSLVYDQVAFEIIPRINKIPFEFRAVDGATIRIASPERDDGTAYERTTHQRNLIEGMTGPLPYRQSSLYTGSQYGSTKDYMNSVQYVQVINGQVENQYGIEDLAFGVRNPRADIYVQGYGFGEVEQAITTITALLHSEAYNRNFFLNGSHPKGLLNFKGDNFTPETLEAFKKQWIAQVSGTENSWKTPITQSEGLEWVNMQMTNQDMQFNVWVEYLLKILCGIYLIDPAEINFDLHGGVQQTPLFESSQEWKLKASRDRGLKPLLRFFASLINEYVIDPIDDHFVFEFAGLDELTEQEKHEMLKEQLASYKTLNEVRRELDMPELDQSIGEVPLNPNLLQLMQINIQQEQQQQQMAMQQQEQQAAQQQPQEGEQPEQSGPEQELSLQAGQLKLQQMQQQLQQDADRHPVELEILKQKLAQPEQPGGSATGQSEAGVRQDKLKQKAKEPSARYASLIGKSKTYEFTLDEWLEQMRNKKKDKAPN